MKIPYVTDEMKTDKNFEAVKSAIERLHCMIFITPVHIENNLTWNGIWQILDCSKWIPKGSTAAIFSVQALHAGDWIGNFGFRRINDSGILITILSSDIASANYRAGGMAIVPLNTVGLCSYKAPANADSTRFCIIYGYIT